MKLNVKIIAFALFIDSIAIASAQDYRDSFIGLYHTSTPPCVSANDQSPPNRYVLIEKDSGVSTGIFVTDSMWFQTTYGFRHPCTLNQSDSSYMDGAQLGKFVKTDSLRISTVACGSGLNYFLKKISPVGIINNNYRQKEWYCFPNPAVNELNIVLPGSSEKLLLSLLDLSGKKVFEKEFNTQVQIQTGEFPKGIYLVLIQGKEMRLTKRIIISD